VSIGIGVIVYLVALYCVMMLIIWYAMRRHRIERPPVNMVPFALPTGYTILGVLDTPKIVYFCIGKDVVEEKEYE